MTRLTVVPAVVALTAALGAQAPADPTGHWEGTVQAPQKTIAIEIDLARDASGAWAGTLGMPGEHLKGLPLARVAADGSAIEFAARTDQTIKGVVSPDGRVFSGSFIVAEGTAPVSLTRTGEARIEPAPVIAPVGKDLEGSWTGVIDAGGRQLHLVLTIANAADRAVATLVNKDEGSLAVPVTAIDRTGSAMTLRFAAVGASYAAALNADRSELTGTYTQGAFSAPMTFRRTK